jgi:hypothetical protein
MSLVSQEFGKIRFHLMVPNMVSQLARTKRMAVIPRSCANVLDQATLQLKGRKGCLKGGFASTCWHATHVVLV